MAIGKYLRAAVQQAQAALAEIENSDTSSGRALSAARETSGRWAESASAKVDAFMQENQDSAALSRTVDAIQRTQAVVAKVPGITAGADAVKAKYGLGELAQQVNERPTDPWPYLWLAEALQAAARSRKVIKAGRTVFEPSTLLTSSAIAATNRVSRGDDRPLEERLLRKAYLLAVRTQLADPVNAEAIHVIGRVYAARGMSAEAMSSLSLARIATTDADASVLVSAGFVALSAGDTGEARRLARAAVTAGHSMGWEILAGVTSHEASGSLKERHEAASKAADFSTRVRTADIRAYRGVHTSIRDAIRDAGESQKQKATSLIGGTGSVPRQISTEGAPA